MNLNRRDFIKTAGALMGTALSGSPAEALELFDKLAKFHNLTKEQKNIVKNIQSKHKLNQSELSSVFGWIEREITPLQIEQLINFSRAGMDQQGIKKIVKEFERGELVPEKGFEINYVFWEDPRKKDRVELIKFEKEGKIYYQFIYNLDKGTKNKIKTPASVERNNEDNKVEAMIRFQHDQLRKVNQVDKGILKELTWLQSMGLALPPEYLCQEVKKKSDNDATLYDHIRLSKVNHKKGREDAFFSGVEIARRKISIYSEGADKQVDLVKEDGRVKIIFHPSGDNEAWEDVFAESEVKRVLKDFFKNE